MNVRHGPLRVAKALFPVVLLCAAAVTPLAGQQAPDSARVAPRSVVSSAAPNTLGPRLSLPFQRVEPRLAARNSESPGPLKMEAGQQHVIVLSTLALVVVVVIITVLVVK